MSFEVLAAKWAEQDRADIVVRTLLNVLRRQPMPEPESKEYSLRACAEMYAANYLHGNAGRLGGDI